MANFTNHPKYLRSSEVSEDCYFYAVGQQLGLPPHKAPIHYLPDYKDFIHSTNLYKGDK